MTPFDRIARRYLDEPQFRALVTGLRQGLVSKQFSERDLKQAVRFAIVGARRESDDAKAKVAGE